MDQGRIKTFLDKEVLKNIPPMQEDSRRSGLGCRWNGEEIERISSLSSLHSVHFHFPSLLTVHSYLYGQHLTRYVPLQCWSQQVTVWWNNFFDPLRLKIFFLWPSVTHFLGMYLLSLCGCCLPRCLFLSSRSHFPCFIFLYSCCYYPKIDPQPQQWFSFQSAFRLSGTFKCI